MGLKRLFPSSSFWAWLKGSTPGCSWGGGGALGGGEGFPDVLIVWSTFAISIWDAFAVDMERYIVEQI